MWLLGSQATSRYGTSRSAGNRSRSRNRTVSAIGLRCSCSTESARIGSWQNPSLKRSHIRRRSSSTCRSRRLSRAVPAISAIDAGAAGRRSGSELGYSEIDVAGVSSGRRRRAAIRASVSEIVSAAGTGSDSRQAPSWCPPVLRCRGRWQPHGATPTRTTCQSCSELYGGDFRKNPSLIGSHASDAGPAQPQISLSASRHDRVDEPAVALVAAAANAYPDGQR